MSTRFRRRRPALGAPLLKARFARAYLDPNREPFELDPAMFEDALPDYVNSHSPRVRVGLGTIARVVAIGEEIYARKLRFAEAVRARRAALPALSPRAEAAGRGDARALRLLSAGRLPFDAVHDHAAASAAASAAAPISCSAIATAPSCHPIVTDTAQQHPARQGLCGGAQRALCRRLHHRPLRQAAAGGHGLQIEIEPRALHGRAQLRAESLLRAARRRHARSDRRARRASIRRC